jgi:hypothetical protein
MCSLLGAACGNDFSVARSVLHTRQAPASTPNNVGAEDQPQLTNPTQEIAGYQQKYMYNSRDTLSANTQAVTTGTPPVSHTDNLFQQ